jgi:hypothetical protein
MLNRLKWVKNEYDTYEPIQQTHFSLTMKFLAPSWKDTKNTLNWKWDSTAATMKNIIFWDVTIGLHTVTSQNKVLFKISFLYTEWANWETTCKNKYKQMNRSRSEFNTPPAWCNVRWSTLCALRSHQQQDELKLFAFPVFGATTTTAWRTGSRFRLLCWSKK